ncbi:MAG: hypothetical protein ACYSW7_07690 [Planctomycetota bacterium]|jgi:hypothetical protein
MKLTFIDCFKNRPLGILDSELAALVGYKTKKLNEATKRSTFIEAREPYCYQLSADEWLQLQNTIRRKKHLSRLRFRPNSARPYIYTFEGACLVIGRLRINLSDQKKQALLNVFSRNVFPIINYGEGRREEYLRDRLSIIFDGLVTVVPHYPVNTKKGQFFIDIYLKEWNIAIEVDEIGHRWDPQKDQEREQAIREVIGCRFLRFVEDSDADRFINHILKILRPTLVA